MTETNPPDSHAGSAEEGVPRHPRKDTPTYLNNERKDTLMKKISAILLALIMMFSMVAMAATISVTPPTGDGIESGIEYNAYKVFDAVISGDNVAYTIDSNNQFYTAISSCSYFKLEQLNGTSTYIVTPNDNYNSEEAAKTLAALLKPYATTADATFSNSQPSADVADGYYLITSTVGDALILDTTQNTAFSTKNQYPTIDKDVNTHSANLGDTVTYTITVDVPANANGTIVVHDEMTGLKYVGMTAAVAGVTESTTCQDDCDVEFTIDAEVTKGTTVIIVYTAVVTADTANNEAYLVDGSYTSNPDTDNDVHNYKFDVFKYTKGENDSEVGLAGAGFVLKNADGKYYKYTPATDTTDAKVEWVNDITDASEYFTSVDDNYKVEFVGLANGTYTLVENTVPAGYNAAQNMTITIKDKDELGTYKVLNSTGSELPSTGGMGTTLFYVIGGLMMAAAVVVLVAKKKVAAK